MTVDQEPSPKVGTDEHLGQSAAGDVYQNRLFAAGKSLGQSSDRIYDRVMALASDMRFCGDALDFGAGTGRFTQKLHRESQFKSITGADIFGRPDTLPDSIGWFCGDLNTEIGLPAAVFDVVFCLETIEHLENPWRTLRYLHYLLREDGLLLLSTPNCESLRSYISLLARGHYAAFTGDSYPAHITPMLRLDLERGAAKAGFTSIAFDYGCPGGVPGWPRLHWHTITFGLAQGRLFSDNLIMTCRKSGSDANVSQ